MNKKLYQTAGTKKKKDIYKRNITITPNTEITKDLQSVNVIPKDEEWKDGKIVKLVTTGSKTKRVQIGVYYIDAKGNKVRGLKPPKGSVPRHKNKKVYNYIEDLNPPKQTGGLKKYQTGGIFSPTGRVTRNVNTDMFDPNLNAGFRARNSGADLRFNLNPRLAIGPDRELSFSRMPQSRLTFGPNLSHSISRFRDPNSYDNLGIQDRTTLGGRASFQSPIGRGGLIAGLSGEAGKVLSASNKWDVPLNANNRTYAQGQLGLGYYPRNSNLGIKGNIGYGTEGSSMPGLSYGVTGSYGPATINVGKDRQGFNAGFGISLPLGTRKRRQDGGTRFNLGASEMEFVNTKGNPISPAGSSISGDIQKIFTDRSMDNLSSSDTLYYNMPTGVIDYYDPESGEKSNIISKDEQLFPFGQRQANAPYLGTMKQTGGMYGPNTLSAAGQGSAPQLGTTSTIIGQETDPALQQARMQALMESGQRLEQEGTELSSNISQQAEIDKQTAKQRGLEQGFETARQFGQASGAIEGALGTMGETVGSIYGEEGQGGLGNALGAGRDAYNITKAANIGQNIGSSFTPAGQAAIAGAEGTALLSSLPEGASVMSDAVTGATTVVDASGNVIKGGSAIGSGLGAFAKSGAGIGTIASLAGMGISALSDDSDPTHSNVGEYTGSILGSAGTGATIGSYLGPAGTVIGGVAGALYGAGSEYFGTQKAKAAQERAEEDYARDQQQLRDKQVTDFNERIGGLYGSYLSSARAGALAQKTVSGQNLGRNVMYKHGGMMLGIPRYGYNS